MTTMLGIRNMTNLTKRTSDNDFGPFLSSAERRDFDFTLLFEETILSILPSVLLLLLVPIRVSQLWNTPRKVVASHTRDAKIALVSIFALLQVVNLVAWCVDTRLATRASTAAASLSLLAALSIWILSYLEHSRSVRPSSILNAYLLLTVILDATKLRTLWLRGGPSFVASIGSSVLLAKLMVLMLEAFNKRRILLSPYSEYSPEATSGLYSRSLFWWLNPMFLLGYRSVIREIDLYPTDNDLSSEALHQKFQRLWVKRQTPARRYELLLTVTRCLVGPLAVGVFPRLCMTFFRYMQPLLIKRVTQFVTQPVNQETTNQGWGLTAAYGLVFFGLAFSSANYYHRNFRLTTMVRGILVTTVYGKTMELAIHALDENAAVTLMSTDVQRVCDALENIHEPWACLMDLSLAIWFLYSELGIAMLGPLTVSLLAVVAMVTISSRTGLAQKTWLTSIQTRVDITAKALQSMKGVKMLGLTTTLTDIVQRLRTREIDQSLKTRQLFGYSLVSGNITDLVAPGIAFAIFTIVATQNGQTLNVSSAYAALSVIALLSTPVKTLTFTAPALITAVGCFDRIQDYLLSATKQDHRLLKPSSDEPNAQRPSSSTDDTFEAAEGIPLKEMTPARSSKNRQSSNTSISVVNLTLSWDDVAKPVVSDVSFDLSPGVTMLVGPVGCGKSSLLKGLLGEVPSSKGYIYTDCLQTAYVGQNPWIQHGTLRDNIVGVSTFEHKFYSTVVHACALEKDFETMNQGDLTHVGSSGSGLSGGQKLRVALARAVYSRRHILILDDVFSGLDASSEDQIFSRLLGKKGLLREMDATVLLATHAAHRLSYADKIIALDTHGRSIQQGSFSELMRSGGYVSGLAARHTAEAEDRPQETAELTRQLPLDDAAQTAAADDLRRAVGDWSVYKYYFASIGYGKTAMLLGLELAYGFFYLFPSLWVKFWTSAVAAHGNSVNGMYLGIMLLLEFTSVVLLAWMSFHAYTKMIPISARTLHQRLLTTAKNAPLWFFTSTDVGQVVNRFSQDLNVIDFELPSAMFELIASTGVGLFQAIFICLSAMYFAAVMPAVLGLMYLIQKFYLRTSRQVRLMELEAKAPLYSNFIESVDGLATIRAFGWGQDFEKHNLALLDRSQRPFYMLFCIQRWLNLVLDLTVSGLAVLLMVLIVTLRDKLDAGLVGLALLNITNFNLSLTEIIKRWTALETALGAIARVKTFVQDTTSEHLPQESNSVPEAWPLRGSIAFTNVSASYTTLGPSVLHNINLSIPAGQKLGLVGRSGSGKSSFVTTLFHMLEITAGSITVDDIDLASVPRETVRQRLNVLPQDPLFIAGSIRSNLDPLSVAQSDSALMSVLDTVGLLSIVLGAGGLDVPMDPEDLLSHGQRQLFCLARAIVNKRQSRILVLDEATASVDLQTDETMQRIIREEFKDCTIIAVAHRLGTIRDFDKVVVLDRGKIVEQGSPDELLGDVNSRFKKLWDS